MVRVNAFVCIVIGMLVAVIQPYKAKVYNIVDTVLILSVGSTFVAGTSLWISNVADPKNHDIAVMTAIVPSLIPFLYIGGYLGLKIGRRYYQSLGCIFIKVKAMLLLQKIKRMFTDVRDTS